MKNIKYMFLSIVFLPVFMQGALEQDLMKLNRSMGALTMTLKAGVVDSIQFPPVETEEQLLQKKREQEELLLKQEEERLARVRQEQLLREQAEKLRKEEEEKLLKQQEEERKKNDEFAVIARSVLQIGVAYSNNDQYLNALTEEEFNKFKADLSAYFEVVLNGKPDKDSLTELGVQPELVVLLKKIIDSTTNTFDEIQADIGFGVDSYPDALNKIKQGIEEFKQVK